MILSKENTATLSTWVSKDCTIGRLDFLGFKCLTLELPWKNNQKSISCIPSGIYDVVKYKSPSKGDVLLLKDVPGRTFIEIHAGNYTRQVEGCILVGDSIRYLDADGIPDVTNSKNTLSKFLNIVPDKFQLILTRVG